MGTRKDTIQCTKCFTINPEDSEYCTRCGTPLEEKDETISYSPDYDISRQDVRLFNPGDNFGHRFKIIEEIGRGGMGRVYKAKDNELNTTVAIKVIRPKFSSDNLFVKRLIKETLIARSISHENVVRIHDIGEIADIKYISMDYIAGENLKELLRTSGKLTIETAVKISKHICESLKAAHKKGIVHRDLKPQNIMVDKNGIAYTMDFGLARAVKSRDKMIPGSIYGTPQYTSPEQAKGEETDERSDIYSLGTIMYEMVAGEPLVKGRTKEECLQSHIKDTPIPPSKINPRTPQSLENIILKCLQKRREERYQNIEEVLKALNECEGRLEPLSAWSKKRKWVIAPAASALVIIIGIFISIKLNIFKPSVLPPEGERISIAVMYFENNTGEESFDHLRRTVSSLITFDLLQSKYIRPLTADRLLEIYKKLDLMNAISYSRGDLKKIAAESGVDHILLGNIYKNEGRYRINTMIQEVGSWKPIGTAMVEGESPNSLVDPLVKKIKSVFNLSDKAIAADIDENIGEITTESTEALNYYFDGIKLYIEGNFEESTRLLQKAVELDPEFAMAYKQMAANYHYDGKMQLTKQALETALSFLDRISLREKYLIRGFNAYVINNSPQEAIQNYQELLKLYPDDVDGLIHLGSTYRNLEEWDLALEQFEKILKIDSQNIEANQNLYFLYTAKGLYDKAIEVLNNKQDVFPEKVQTQRTIGIIFAIQHKTDLAQQHADAALSIDPENSENILNKGNIYHLTGSLGNAKEYYQKLSRKEDKNSKLESLFWMTHLYLLKGEHQKSKNEVIQALQIAQELKEEIWEIEFLLLDAYLDLKMKRIPDALASANLAKEKASRYNLMWKTELALLYQGLVHLEMNNQEAANRVSEQLKEFIDNIGGRSDRRYYFFLRGEIALQQGFLLQATDLFEMAYSLLPEQMTIYDEHAFFLEPIATSEEKNGNIDSALKHFNKIADLTTGRLRWGDIYAKSFLKLGEIYAQKGQKEKAIENYEKFLELWKDSKWGLEERKQAEKKLSLLK